MEGIFPRGEFTEGEFYGSNFPRGGGIFSRARNFLGANFLRGNSVEKNA